ncbi:MAG: Hsp20/alpha crystallin family protein [Acidobacteriota bacterium]
MNKDTRLLKGNVAVSGGTGTVPVRADGQRLDRSFGPTFTEAERMFERMAEVTRRAAENAFSFFSERGGELGRELEDWFKAETELLRPAPIEITENSKEIKVKAIVAGFDPEDIEVKVKDNSLTINGESEEKNRKDDESTFYSEWRSNRFFRQMTLPSEVDAERTRADLSDGVLEIVLPKLRGKEPTKVKVHS